MTRKKTPPVASDDSPADATLEAIVAAFQAERERQDAEWGGPEHDDEHYPDDWIHFIFKHARRATSHSRGEITAEAYVTQLERIGAIVVAALQAFHRHVAEYGAPHQQFAALPAGFDAEVPDLPRGPLSYVQMAERLEEAEKLLSKAQQVGDDLQAAVAEIAGGWGSVARVANNSATRVTTSHVGATLAPFALKHRPPEVVASIHPLDAFLETVNVAAALRAPVGDVLTSLSGDERDELWMLLEPLSHDHRLMGVSFFVAERVPDGPTNFLSEDEG